MPKLKLHAIVGNNGEEAEEEELIFDQKEESVKNFTNDSELFCHSPRNMHQSRAEAIRSFNNADGSGS